MQQETKPITREEYDNLTPYAQGYVTYMRAEHPGWKIPKKNPHKLGSHDSTEWDRGSWDAYLIVLDCDDD